jgi:hypothetical protein
MVFVVASPVVVEGGDDDVGSVDGGAGIVDDVKKD